MKAQYIYKYLIIGLIALLLAACTNTDAEQKFDQTPTERLNSRKAELNDALLSSENGWKAVYFTDNTVLGGYTHLIKFAKDGTAEMASDFDDDTAVYKSEYEIQLGSTVSLVFTTKNRIHLLSDSDDYPIAALRSEGYHGDFQFLYYGQENGEIIFKTNRVNETTGVNGELRFVKATAQDWTDLHKNIDMIPNVVGASTRPLFRLLETNDGKTIHQFDFSFSEITRFAEANSIETGYSVSYDMGIGYSPTGIVVSPAVEVGGQKLTTFVYNASDGSFTATGTNGVSATIKYSSKPLVLTDDYKILLPLNANVVYGHDRSILELAPTNSLSFISIFKTIESTLAVGSKLTRIQPWFNTPNGSYVEYRFVSSTGATTRVYHYFTLTSDATNKTITLHPTTIWKKGSTFANAVTISAEVNLKDLDDNLMNPKGLYFKRENFTVGASNAVFTFTSTDSPFRMTTWAFQ
jgi:hypothetical protein